MSCPFLGWDIFFYANSWYPLFWNNVRKTRRKHDAFLTKTRRGQSEKGKTRQIHDENRTPVGIRFHPAFSCRTFAPANGKVKTENGKLIA